MASQFGLQGVHKFLIEYYDDERFRGMHNSESELDVCVPIKKTESSSPKEIGTQAQCIDHRQT